MEKRSKEVHSTQNSHLHDCLIYIFVQIKLRKAYTGDSPRNQRRLRLKQRELRRVATACNANVLTNFLKQPVSFYISLMHLWCLKSSKNKVERTQESAITEFEDKLNRLISGMETMGLEDECGTGMVCIQLLLKLAEHDQFHP